MRRGRQRYARIQCQKQFGDQNPYRDRLAATEPAEAAWLSIEGDAERDLETDTMTQFVVNIQVPEGCKPGKYSYRLRVFDPENPGEKFVDGENVYFEVKEKIPAPAPDGDNKKRWIPYVVAAVIAAVVIGVAIKIVMDKRKVEVPEVVPSDVVEVPPKIVEVPDLEDVRFVDALVKINARGLTFVSKNGLVFRRVADRRRIGLVVDQEPDAHTKVPEKTEIKLWVGAENKIQKVQIDKMISVQEMNKIKTMKNVTMPKSFIERSMEPEPESK